MVNYSQIRAFANADHVLVAWRFEASIPDCLGFAIFRKRNYEPDACAEPVYNSIGFAGQQQQPGEQRLCTDWPLQRYTWIDYDVRPGERLNYKVFPILLEGGELIKNISNATAWSDMVQMGSGRDIEAVFNRGILGSSHMSHQLDNLQPADKESSMVATLQDYQSPLRQFLGGTLAERLMKELDQAGQDKELKIYAVLKDIPEGVLKSRLNIIGKRAQVICSTGSKRLQPEETNEKYILRVLPDQYFTNQNYIIFCRGSVPYQVWVGSGQLTETGLYLQANKALLIHKESLASQYLDDWHLLLTAANDLPGDYIDFKANQFLARDLIKKASHGILFLLTQSGKKDSLPECIMDRYRQGGPPFFIQGMLNPDPAGKSKALLGILQGQQTARQPADLLPQAAHQEFSYWTDELVPEMVSIHSQLMVMDPFGRRPVVMTCDQSGNHLSIINDEPELALQLAVYITTVFNNYMETENTVLSRDPQWMAHSQTPDRQQELNFFLGLQRPIASMVPENDWMAIDHEPRHLA